MAKFCLQGTSYQKKRYEQDYDFLESVSRFNFFSRSGGPSNLSEISRMKYFGFIQFTRTVGKLFSNYHCPLLKSHDIILFPGQMDPLA